MMKNCLVCEQTIECSKKQKYCNSCRKLKLASNKNQIDNLTKKDFFTKNKNWQSARSSIRRHAVKIYNRSNRIKACQICGYNKHFEICHIKAVSNFDNNALIKDINHIDNLIALCPNHHWEFDNQKLAAEGIEPS